MSDLEPTKLYAAVAWPDQDVIHVYAAGDKTQCGESLDEFVVRDFIAGQDSDTWCPRCVEVVRVRP